MKMGAPFEALLNLGEDQGSGVARRLPQVGRQKVRGSDLVAAQSQPHPHRNTAVHPGWMMQPR
jgi:hypothetical protein